MNRKTWIGCILASVGAAVLVCTIAFAWFGYRFFMPKELVFEPEQVSYAEPDSITIPGFDEWEIAANETYVACDLYNPDGNICYFEITVTLQDSGSVIYHSKLLRPGQHLYHVELQTPIPAGRYNAVMHYSTISIEDNSPMNGADVPFTLIAK